MYWTLDLASKLEDACGMRMNTNGQIDYCLAYEAVPLWDGFCV